MNRLWAAVGIAIVLGGAAKPSLAATLSLAAAPNPASFAQNVQITATLLNYDGGSTVSFYDGQPSPNTFIGNASVTGTGSTRTARLNKSNFSVGTHNLSAFCCTEFIEGGYSEKQLIKLHADFILPFNACQVSILNCFIGIVFCVEFTF